MGRDMTGTGRYPPQPRYTPLSFYSAVRLGDPEMLKRIMVADPYFITQDNGAGAPVHFATTYRQLDMLHHLLNNGAEVNQRDPKGLTPLHRAAYLAHLDGYQEIYEYLLSRGADPSILSEDFDPYLNPGPKRPVDLAVEDPSVRQALLDLEAKYAQVEKAPRPHEDIGDWWALYDYGLEAIQKWSWDFKPPYPEDLKRQRDLEALKRQKQEQRTKRDTFLANYKALGVQAAAALVTATATTPQQPSAAAAASAGAASPPTVAFLFPGQGSQAVGMLKDAQHLPAVQQMLAKAQEVLGYDLLDVCLNGPKEKLDRTEFSQPALFVAGLAAVELLRSRGHEGEDALAACGAAAGLSLGEYCALVFAGALSFEDGLKVVKVRSQSMAAAAAQGEPHGMLSVVGLPDATLQALCDRVLSEAAGGPPEAAAAAAGTVCCVANYLFPQGRVVSGHLSALRRVAELATEAQALKVQQLAVAGAFHTRLMQPAAAALAQVLGEVRIQAPRLPVISNVTAEAFPADPARIRELLTRQLLEPVLWERSLVAVAAAGGKQLWELGPGQQLKAMVRRIDPDAWKAFQNVQP